MSPTTPTESAVKEIIEDLAANSAEMVARKTAGWPKDLSDAGARLTTLITEQVNVLLSGDVSALRDALVADVIRAIKNGKGPVAKQFTDLA